MELIRQIKQAESQAKEIVEQAHTEAARQAEQAKARRDELCAAAEVERKKAIKQAATEAETAALSEVENLKSEGHNRRQRLCEAAKGKTDAAVAKVMDYLKGL